MVLEEVAGYFLAGILVIGALGGGAYFFDIFDFVDDQINSVDIQVEVDDGIYEIDGEGKYRKGDSVSLTAIVYLGWIFDGWFSEDGTLLSESQLYEFEADDSKFKVQTHRGYGVEIFSMDGAFPEGRDSYELDEAATVSLKTRTDTNFLGWYDVEGNLLSMSRTFTLPDKKDITLIAKTDGDDYSGEVARTITAPKYMDYPTITWAITNKYTGDYADSASGQSFTTYLDPGFYILTMYGYKTDGTYVKTKTDFSIEGDITNHYHWFFNDRWYSLDWTISSDVFQGYIDSKVNRSPQTDSARADFVYYKSGTVQNVAGSLLDLGYWMDDNEYANFVLKFVQGCTEYELDSDFSGKSDYWKYPAETLMHHKGDCEDTTILYCALMKASGFDTALLLYLGGEYIDKGHAAAGVDLDYVPGGSYYNKNGKHYYYCETTSDSKNVGDIWDEYDSSHIIEIK